jgi:predicted DNA-binding protein YlxM (UPF0122 family)
MSNGIHDMAGLVATVTKINEDFHATSDQIKKVDRRMGTLETHLERYDAYKKHKPIYDKYKKLDPKKAEAFFTSTMKRYRNTKPRGII